MTDGQGNGGCGEGGLKNVRLAFGEHSRADAGASHGIATRQAAGRLTES